MIYSPCIIIFLYLQHYNSVTTLGLMVIKAVITAYMYIGKCVNIWNLTIIYLLSSMTKISLWFTGITGINTNIKLLITERKC